MFTDDYGNRRFPGLYRGIVFDTRDPLDRGRLRLQVPQVLFDEITDWAWAKRDPGAPEATPAVGTGVWVQFEGGDPSYPVWVGTFTSSATGGGAGGGGLPAGGLTGQILTKSSNTDYDATWQENYADWTSTVKHYAEAAQILTKGQAVYVSSSNGTNIKVSKASNTSEGLSSKTLGIIAQDLNTTSNKFGYVVSEGLLTGLNTSSANEGDPVWLGVDGALIFGLVNKPVAPANLVFLGVVTKKSAGNGEIFVAVQNGFELQELHNVLIGSGYASTPDDNDILAYDSTSSLWKNQTAAQANLVSTSDARLTDTRTPTDGSVTTAKIVDANVTNAKLTNSSVTINGSSVSLGGSVTVGAAPTGSAGGKLSGTYPNPGINASLDDLNDVTVTGTPADNNLVAWNSATSQWTNQTASQAGVIATPNGTGTSLTLNGLTHAEGIDVTRYVEIGGADDDFSPALTVQANEDIDGSYPIAVFKSSNGTQVGGIDSIGTIDAPDFTRSGTPLSRVYSQTTEPAGGNIGDIWIDTDSAQNTVGATPRFEASRVATNQSVPNLTGTTLTYPTIVENVGGFVYNAGVITVPLTGRYSFTFNPTFEPNQSGRRFVRVYKTSTATTALWQVRFEPPGTIGDGNMLLTVASERLTGGDTLLFTVTQGSGASLNITDARLVIEYLGA